MYRVNPNILKNIEAWIEGQKRFLEYSRKSEEILKNADRLSLMIAARTACSQIIKTIKGFDAWLQNPLVIGLMPHKMLKEVQEQLWRIMYELTLFDIEHTGKYKEHLKKIIEEGKILPPLPTEEKEERTLTYTR
ncbi:MAG: DUF2153 domain-containing protein [archaeon GB-1845-036]|nr:DUF2153 domain-containing protein [Candidatus Culexmicrobium thermophilum]HDO20651.1 DUF2153 domain-containing protein [Candidatus Bathyarchaeota archaeon]